jgi:phosphoglycerate kinase
MFPTAKAIMEKYPDKIVIPVDVAIDVNGKRKEVKKEDFPPSSEIRDIGSETIRLFSEFAKDARSLVINGPLGLFEDEKFATGTVEFIRSLSKSKAYSVMGGGHSVAALEQYGIADCISYISTGGGAMISYLSGERLPGVEALKAAAK